MVWSYIISIIAIIVSVFVALYEYTYNKKLNSINLESSYLEKIFADFLVNKIPEARNKIRFVSNKLDGINDLQNEVISIRKSALYYKYTDKDFYNDLKKNCQNLEDFIVTYANVEITGEDQYDISKKQMNILNKIETKIEDIYACINTKYKEG